MKRLKLDYDTMCAIIECMIYERDRFERTNDVYHIKRIDSLIDDFRMSCGYPAVEREEAAE